MYKDIIYRDDAIEAIHKEARLAGGSVVIQYADMFQEVLLGLPSAQLEPEPDPEWRKSHYEAAYAQGFVDGCKSYERQPDFDMTEKIDKANDDGYKQGYLQVKVDYERKKGKWIPQDYNQRYGNISTTVYYYPKCSVCGCCGDYTDAFCKFCGADMRGVQNE